MSSEQDEVDEDRLYAAATQGDAEAFDRLLESYLPQLHAFVRVRMGGALRPRESSMDVVQSVCRQLVSARSSFDFRGEQRFRAWLFTSALNKIREKHRMHRLAKRDVRREAHPEHVETMRGIAHLLTPSADAVGHETAAALADSLAALSEEHREVITLARLVRLPHKVIGEMMDRSDDAVRQLLGRALLQLTKELRKRGIDVSKG